MERHLFRSGEHIHRQPLMIVYVLATLYALAVLAQYRVHGVGLVRYFLTHQSRNVRWMSGRSAQSPLAWPAATSPTLHQSAPPAHPRLVCRCDRQRCAYRFLLSSDSGLCILGGVGADSFGLLFQVTQMLVVVSISSLRSVPSLQVVLMPLLGLRLIALLLSLSLALSA